jgi:hypothetical protein
MYLKRILPIIFTPFRLHGWSRARYLVTMTNTVAIGSHNLVASRKAREGGNPLKTGMNKRRSGNIGSGDFW